MPNSSNYITFKDVEPYLAHLDFTKPDICTDAMLEYTDYCINCPFRTINDTGSIIGCNLITTNIRPLRSHISHSYPELLI